MLFLVFLALYILLGIIMAMVIAIMPEVWSIKIAHLDLKIVAWPIYSAWGIGWVITGLWILFGWPMEQYLKLFVAFHVCFPLIIAGAQFNLWLKTHKFMTSPYFFIRSDPGSNDIMSD